MLKYLSYFNIVLIVSIGLAFIANAADMLVEQHPPQAIQQEQVAIPATSPADEQERIPPALGADILQQTNSSIKEQKKADISLGEEPNKGSQDSTTLSNTETASKISSCKERGGRCSSSRCDYDWELIDGSLSTTCYPFHCCIKRESCTGENRQSGICQAFIPTEIRPIIGKCNDGEFCIRIPYRSSVEALLEILANISKSQSDMVERPPTLHQQDSSFTSLLGADSWFSFITGTASVLGLILALMYPVQIYQAPPSEYRSLRWKKLLIISFGISLMVNSLLAFSILFDIKGFLIDLHQIDTIIIPDQFLKSIDYDNRSYNKILIYIAILIKQRLVIWMIMFIIGFFIFMRGVFINPASIIENKLKETLDRLYWEEQKKIKNLVGKQSFEELPIQGKLTYKRIINEFKEIKSQVFNMLTGTYSQKESYLNKDDEIV